MATTTEELQEIMVKAGLAKKKYTFEEYLAWPGEEKKVEWVDGEITVMAASSIRHELLLGFLQFVLKAYTLKHNSGLIFTSNVAMKLAADRRGRQPDLLFISHERARLLRENHLDGPADLVVEIVSPESVGRDRGEKFVEYEAAGIREYWYLDPQRQEVEFYRLDDAGRYRNAPIDDGVFRSQVINGFWLRVAWLWELPNELDTLRELGVIQ
jgi:Uma2 family endonuclease